MASTKDILSAQRFNRARLMTAFQSGMPEGRELTPTRPWGSLIAGLLITALLFGGAWVSKLFVPSLPAGWESGSLVTDDVTGARYVTIDGVLHPVRNAASAKLLHGQSLKVLSASTDTLSEAPLGDPVGIAGAPDQIPAEQAVADPSLVACLSGDSQLRLGVSTGDAEIVDGAAAHVTSEGTHYLIAGSYRYVLGDDEVSAQAILDTLNLNLDTAIAVPASWLNVFDEGEPLTALTLDKFGESVGPLEGIDSDVLAGSILRVSDTANQGTAYVVTADGSIERLSPVMESLYSIGDGAGAVEYSVTQRDIAQLDLSVNTIRPTWPTEISTLVSEEQMPCALASSQGSEETTALALAPASDFGKNGVEVTPQGGAIVRRADSTGRSLTYLIDENGIWHPLSSPSETLGALGLANADTLRVGAAWIDLYSTGPTLSVDAAWATVPGE